MDLKSIVIDALRLDRAWTSCEARPAGIIDMPCPGIIFTARTWPISLDKPGEVKALTAELVLIRSFGSRLWQFVLDTKHHVSYSIPLPAEVQSLKWILHMQSCRSEKKEYYVVFASMCVYVLWIFQSLSLLIVTTHSMTQRREQWLHICLQYTHRWRQSERI